MNIDDKLRFAGTLSGIFDNFAQSQANPKDFARINTNKTILVAGGAGYLGSKLCEAILLHNGNICIADINLEKINSLPKKLETKMRKRNFFLRR